MDGCENHFAPRNDTMGNHLLVFIGESYEPGFLGGAEFRPSTVGFGVCKTAPCPFLTDPVNLWSNCPPKKRGHTHTHTHTCTCTHRRRPGSKLRFGLKPFPMTHTTRVLSELTWREAFVKIPTARCGFRSGGQPEHVICRGCNRQGPNTQPNDLPPAQGKFLTLSDAKSPHWRKRKLKTM